MGPNAVASPAKPAPSMKAFDELDSDRSLGRFYGLANDPRSAAMKCVVTRLR